MTKHLRYIYHGYVQIAEIDSTDETAPFVTKTYRWDPSKPVATRPLVMSLWTREGAVRETLYDAHDLRKNVASLFDGKGVRRASYQYDPFGNITSMEGDMAKENPYRFSSEHHDEDIGLVYYNYRHYNPTDGRRISRDPIAEQGGVNLYGFVGNNAMGFFDDLGSRPLTTQEQKIVQGLENLVEKYEAYVKIQIKQTEVKTYCQNMSHALQEFILLYKAEIDRIPENTPNPLRIRYVNTALRKALNKKIAHKFSKEGEGDRPGWTGKDKCNLFVRGCLEDINVDCKIFISRPGWQVGDFIIGLPDERYPLAGEWSNYNLKSLRYKFPVIQRYVEKKTGYKASLDGVDDPGSIQMGDIISIGYPTQVGSDCHVGIILSATIYVSATSSKLDPIQQKCLMIKPLPSSSDDRPRTIRHIPDHRH